MSRLRTRRRVLGLIGAAAASAVCRRATRAVAAVAAVPRFGFRDNGRVDATDDLIVVHSDGLPDHSTGPFPDPRNPNAIRKQNYTFRIPRHPRRADRVAPLIGYAFDGYAIPNSDGGKPPADLDECNGHTDPTRGYHYHVTAGFPYILGGYRGVVERSNFDHGGGGPRAGPGGGPRPPPPDDGPP